MNAADSPSVPRLSLAPILAGWFALGLALALAKVIGGRPPLAAIALTVQVGGGVAAYRLVPSLRAAVDALDLRVLILFHTVRAPIGAAFLVLMTRGMLAPTFAMRGGIGDLVAGLLALVAAGFVARRRLVLAWNAYGLLDIAVTVATAQKLALIDHDPLMLGAFEIWPFGLLPFFVVPLVVLTHLAIFVRLRR